MFNILNSYLYLKNLFSLCRKFLTFPVQVPTYLYHLIILDTAYREIRRLFPSEWKRAVSDLLLFIIIQIYLTTYSQKSIVNIKVLNKYNAVDY